MRQALIFTLPILLIVGLWAWRNYRVLGMLVPLSTGSGAVLWGANNPTVYGQISGSWINPPLLPGWDEVKGLSEVQQDRAMTARALAYMRSVPPPLLARIALAKLALFWSIGDTTTVWPQWLFVAAACIGLSRRLWRGR
jgi:hypothetical protein